MLRFPLCMFLSIFIFCLSSTQVPSQKRAESFDAKIEKLLRFLDTKRDKREKLPDLLRTLNSDAEDYFRDKDYDRYRITMQLYLYARESLDIIESIITLASFYRLTRNFALSEKEHLQLKSLLALHIKSLTSRLALLRIGTFDHYQIFLMLSSGKSGITVDTLIFRLNEMINYIESLELVKSDLDTE